MKLWIEILGWFMEGYGTLGLLFAGVFQYRGLSRLDPSVQGAGIGFRLLISPGMILLWPWLLHRWTSMLRTGRNEDGVEKPVSPAGLRRLHRVAWRALCVLVPLVLAAALWTRTDPATPLPGSSRGQEFPGEVR